MNYKRAIGISALGYLVNMLLGMAVCALLGIKPNENFIIPPEMWAITGALNVAISLAATYWYFQGKNLKPNLRAGLFFGLAFVAVSFVFDLLFFLSLSFEHYDPLVVMKKYYSEPAFWLALALMLAAASLMGARLEKTKKA
jgi:hypothetical protein